VIRILRSGVAVGAIGVLSVVVAGVGVATAANGGSLVLGHANSATATTTLTDTSGTPLSLVGKSSKPPLSVNSSKQVAHLNASLLGGQSASTLGTSGSGVQTKWVNLSRIFHAISTSDTAATKVASTGTLKPGTYYVSVAVDAFNGDTAAAAMGCFVGPNNNLNDAVQYTGESSAPLVSVDVLAMTKIATSSKLGAYCFAPDASLNTATMFAVKIANSTPGSLPSSGL
jgi:hypothetical protein